MKTPQIRRLETALQKAGADGVLITRLARAERHTEISPGWYQPHLGFGYYGFSPAGTAGSTQRRESIAQKGSM